MKIKLYLFYFFLIVFLVLLLIYIDENMENRYIDKQNKQNVKYQDKKLNPTQIKEGYFEAKKSKINICALARDCAGSIVNNKAKIEELGSYFKDYKIIIFENDSSDNTRDLVKEWEKENSKVHLIKCVNNKECIFKNKKGYDYGQISKKRILKMGYYREQYLDIVKKSDFEYMLVIDIDLDLTYFHNNSFLNILAKNTNWDAVAINCRANVPGTMGFMTIPYDAIAFSLDKNIYNELENVSKKMITNFLNLYKVYNSNDEFVKVGSAFNGVCIYKTDSIRNSTYLNNGEIMCEHLIFHKNIEHFYAAPNWIMYQAKQGDGSVLKQTFNLLKGRELFYVTK